MGGKFLKFSISDLKLEPQPKTGTGKRLQLLQLLLGGFFAAFAPLREKRRAPRKAAKNAKEEEREKCSIN